ncbi:MAG TPA: CAP domain-containing protein [Candidatus Dojkabacteria bacterium]|jgi:hypothetical protein|nr:CAP domain-containing protein [Candidatus Dojkabacteria bacterium]
MLNDFLVPTSRNKSKPYLLRKIAIIAYTIMLLVVNYFGGIFGIDQAYASSITPANIISLTNQERRVAGLPELTNNAKLSTAALAKANDMFAKDYWDHFGPNGETPWQFIRAAGYNYVYAGENLGKGFRTSEGLVEAWMVSPTHRDNMLSPHYKDIGVAVVEGTLLGKQTILVVQMFGNLTSSVQGVTSVPTTTPKVVTGSQKVITPTEQGEIRSIRITSPEMGAMVTDPAVQIKGETTNTEGQYSVAIVESSQLIGTTVSESDTWEFSKESDWSEGEHKITANIQGTNVKSPETTFTIDSKPPIVLKESVNVKDSSEDFTLSFEIDGEWNHTDVVIGSEILPVAKSPENATVRIGIPKTMDTKKVEIVVSDSLGNSSTLDVSEYFKEKEEENIKIIPTLGLSVKDGINIGIVLFVFLLVCAQVIWYAKRGRIKDSVGELFTIGVWWLVIAVAMFNGFSGVIT